MGGLTVHMFLCFFVEKILGPTFSDHRFLGLRFQVLGFIVLSFHVFSGQLSLGFPGNSKTKNDDLIKTGNFEPSNGSFLVY